MIEKSRIKAIALSSGFKLKEQPNGEMDLNPYVYEFASVVFAKGVITVFDDISADLEANEKANTVASVIKSVEKHTEKLSDTNKKLLEKLARQSD